MSDLASTSPLLTAVPDRRRYPPLIGQHEAELVVVGGGIAGVMAAWRLAELGRPVTLIEQNHLATGDTGYTTSFVTRVPDTSLAALAKRHGVDFVRRVMTATSEAQRYLQQLILAQEIDCDWVPCASLNCSYVPNNHVLRDEWKVVQQVDPAASFVVSETDADIRTPLAEAIRYDHEGYFNVRKFIFGLLDRPTAKRITIYEESPVTGLQRDQSGVILTTPKGTLHCQKVMVCTALPPAWLSELQAVVNPVVTYALTAQYDGGLPLANHTYWDTDQPYQYYRWFDPTTLILGGADRAISQPQSVKPHDQLETFLRQRFPGLTAVTHRWSGSLFETADGLPYVCQHPHYPGQVYAATGFAGNGMVQGTMAGMILADLVTATANVHAKLFGFSRTGLTIVRPKPAATPIHDRIVQTKFWRWVATAVYLFILTLPGYIFFSHRGGFSFLAHTDFQTFNLLIFPLVGLYAFTLLWSQFVIGSARAWLGQVIHPAITTFHRRQGVFIFLLAWLHPTLRFFGIGLNQYFKSWNVAPHLVPFVWLGYFQLFLITVTATTALLRKMPWLKRWWHSIHYLNYAVFVSVWTHSWFLGSDVRSTNLRYLWMFFGLTAIASTAERLSHLRRQPAAAPSPVKAGEVATADGPAYTRVATVDQVQENHPFCAMVKGQAIAVFKFGDHFYALDNTCSHAGGPLCQGTQTGSTIECPLHQSVFDVTTGAVKQGPARTAQKTYPLRVSGQQIEISV